MQIKRRLGLWSMAIASGLTASGAAMAGNTHVDFKVVHIGGPALREPSFRAINNREDWMAFWNTPTDPSMLPPSVDSGVRTLYTRGKAPDVDFNQSTLLAVSIGPSTGHSVFFGDIREFDNRIEISVFNMSPGRECAVAQIITYPSALALIPHTLKAIHFKTLQGSVDCIAPHPDVVVSPSPDHQ